MNEDDYEVPTRPVLPDDPGEATVHGWSDAPVAGDRVDVHMGPIIAGDPGGARVEVTGDGLRAYDSTGVETAHIQGEGGEFVGGEFRTSDTLPGQVTLADDAYINSTTGGAHPGIRVEPLDTSDMVRPPGIGPGDRGLYVDGGSDTSGRRSYLRASPTASLMRTHRGDGTPGGAIQTSPTASLMRTYREDGTTGGAVQVSPTESLMHTDREGGAKGGVIQTAPDQSLMRTYRADGKVGGEIQTAPDVSRMRTYSGNSSEAGWVQVRPQDVELAYVDPNNTYFSRIRADANEAFIYTRAGGAGRYLTVDADGVWVKTNKSGTWKWYNLEETAQDSGWRSITLDSGFSGSASLAWRNKGGVIWFRGTVTGSWSGGSYDTVATLPAEVRPVYAYTVNEAGATAGVLIRVQSDGRLEIQTPSAGTSTHRLTSLSYPIG